MSTINNRSFVRLIIYSLQLMLDVNIEFYLSKDDEVFSSSANLLKWSVRVL